MSCEIKFRVWHKTEKRFLLDGEFVIDAQGGVYYLWANGGFRTLSQDSYTDDVVIQQFTGVLDKSGAEIYEGDILEFTDGINKFPSPITFEIGCSGYTFESKFYHLFWYPYEKTVVGNVFENPKSLKT